MTDTPKLAPPLGERPVLTLDEAASLLGVSKRTVQRWANGGGLRTLVLGEAGTLKRVLRADLDAFVDSRAS